MARRDGTVVATDELRTAGAPDTVRLSPDTKRIIADGRSLSYVTADVVDAHGVIAAGAANRIHVAVTGGTLAGLDNGREESAENYKALDREAFNGKALAIVRSADRPGPITVTATSPGLRPASVTIASYAASATLPSADPVPVPTPAPAQEPAADASYSGAADTVPGAMLDGDLATGWSNHYTKDATALLPAISRAHAAEWVSLTWPGARDIGTLQAYFTTGSGLVLPSTITVTYRKDGRDVPVSHLRIDWAGASNQPTTITFDPVETTSVRLDMTSPAPGAATGFLRIAELRTGEDAVPDQPGRPATTAASGSEFNAVLVRPGPDRPSAP